MRGVAGPVSRPIFHVHPLNRCNLECLHCYSESSPQSTSLLLRDQVLGAIRQAVQWGYQSIAISGGEPLLYPFLTDILDFTSSLGVAASIITNGLLARRPATLAVLRKASLVAVSIDGLSQTHDVLRGRMRAFASVDESLLCLRTREFHSLSIVG